MKKTRFAGIVALVLLCSGCTPDEPQFHTGDNYLDLIYNTDAWGVMGVSAVNDCSNDTVIRTTETLAMFPLYLGYFFDYYNAGTVTLNDSLLMRYPDSAYAYLTHRIWDLSSTPMHWVATGGANVPAIDRNYPGISSGLVLQCPDTLRRSQDFTVTTSQVTASDSLTYLVDGAGFDIWITVPPETTAVIFPATLLAQLQPYTTRMVVRQWRRDYITINDKHYYFVNYAEARKDIVVID